MKTREQTPKVRYVEVSLEREGQRLDNYLFTQLKGVPKSHIYRLLRRGEVRINGGRAKPERRIKAGDRIRLPPLRMLQQAPPKLTPDDVNWLEEYLLYEDDFLLIINKPAGLSAHAGSGIRAGLIERLRALRSQNPGLTLIHRLDRDTSGCLLLTKDRGTASKLQQAWREGGVQKTYLALLRGRWEGESRRVSAGLVRTSGLHDQKIKVDETGKHAITEFYPEQILADATLVRINLLTGRTHQARVHAAHIQHPIAGDRKYGNRSFNQQLHEMGLRRLFLHASSLEFQHPVTCRKIRIDAPLPNELAAVLNQLVK
jgi:23S rRNA pseudouridine955/2504/2580 synthase